MRVIVLTLVGAALAAPKHISRIVGGEDTTIDRYPYTANMMYHYYGTDWGQSCVGSLITTTSILSAAHCYEHDVPSVWQARLGTSFRATGGLVIPTSQFILHPRYGEDFGVCDVAIIKLLFAAPLSANIGVARIAGPGYILPDGTPVTALGWGDLYVGIPSLENQQLQRVEVNIINQELCNERYGGLVTDVMVCAGILDVGGKDACQGDSGGPLAHDSDVLVGVSNWGHYCGHPYFPGVYSRVSALTDWIVANA